MRRTLALFVSLSVVGLAGCADEGPVAGPELSPDGVALNASASPPDLTASAPQFTGRYIVLSKSNQIPRGLEERIAQAGGRVVGTIPEIGVLIAEPVTPDFVARASRAPGVESVTPDFIVQLTEEPDVLMEMDARGMGVGQLGVVEETAWFGSFQWAPQAIQAPEAWAAGYTGAGVRVAILDGGIWDQHLDLAPNLDVAASASFVPGFQYNQDTGTFWHGTHVAGIVAATGFGTYGIAPNATLIGVKVLHAGGGAFEWVLNGIVYAATPQELGGAGAHVMNLSLGATIDYREAWGDKAFRDAFRELTKAYDRATRYATQQGTLVIASAGNAGNNFDEARELFKIPGSNQHVVGVSATAPHGFALGAQDFHRFAYYSDHGKSLVDVAAPGGTPGLFVLDGVADGCTVTGVFTSIAFPCFVFDYVVAPSRGAPASVSNYSWAYGTSMAAPAAAGVAALIIEANGGSMNPHALATALRASAVDLGKPGNDEFYGHGWVNALDAVNR
jgi:lantibiotic leader peptide-processing serine protease